MDHTPVLFNLNLQIAEVRAVPEPVLNLLVN
eukprot:SAG31_NODE_17976_length_651_cov_0.844203_1_plen_30_part_01